MPRYFFDTRDGADFVRDEIGIELDGVEAARYEATRGLADFARDALPGSVRRELAVECRDVTTCSGPLFGLRLRSCKGSRGCFRHLRHHKYDCPDGQLRLGESEYPLLGKAGSRIPSRTLATYRIGSFG